MKKNGLLLLFFLYTSFAYTQDNTFSNDLEIKNVNNKQGIYHSGAELLAPVYDYIVQLNDEMDACFLVRADDKYGIYDALNNYFMLQVEYNDIKVFVYSDDYFNVHIFDNTATEIDGKAQGTFIVRKGNISGVFAPRLDGDWLVPPVCDSIQTVDDMLYYNCLYAWQKGKQGLYSIEWDDPILPIKYNEIKVLDGETGVFTMRKGKKTGAVDCEAQWLPLKFDEVIEVYGTCSNHLYRVSLKGKQGIYNPAKVIEPIYDEIFLFNEEFVRVKTANKYGLFSLSNELMVVPVECENIEQQENSSTVFVLTKNGQTELFEDK